MPHPCIIYVMMMLCTQGEEIFQEYQTLFWLKIITKNVLLIRQRTVIHTVCTYTTQSNSYIYLLCTLSPYIKGRTKSINQTNMYFRLCYT